MKKKILIIFPDSHLAYSPTTLNLMSELKKYFDVKIITFEGKSFFHKLEDDSIIYLKDFKFFLRFILKVISIIARLLYGDVYYHINKRILVVKHLFKYKYDRIIAVDLISLWYLKGMVKYDVDSLSLEINNYSKQLISLIKDVKVDNLIIQDENRLKLYKHRNFKKSFLIQNAPPFYEEIELKTQNKKFNKRFVFAGTALSAFGIFSCIDYIQNYKDSYLKIMGAVDPDVLEKILSLHSNLLNEKRLIIDSEYLNEYEYCLKLSEFDIGFCFYDFSNPMIKNKFDNYYHAPSGKMFKYFASGVPIIGIDIPGLSAIKDYNAGILLKDITICNINQAIDKIKQNYSMYVKNCFLAAKEYDFTKNVANYIRDISL